MSIKERIVTFMSDDTYKPMLIGEIFKELNTTKDMKREITRILNELEEEGKIIKTRNERYVIPEKSDLIIGTIQGSQKGFGFLIPDNTDIKDLFISPVDLNGAMNKDRVIVRPMKGNGNTKKPSGEVIKILTRANYEIIGTLQETKNFGFVLPDDKRISQDIFVSKSDFNGAKNGQTVIVKIVEWPGKRRNPEGVVKSILGSSDDIRTFILSALIRNEIRTKFPNKVQREASEIDREITKEEIDRRKDFRDYQIVTIDGADAKDLDDAIHIIKKDNGKYELGIHIADVTHYVREESPLDKEAFTRGTSVYMPGEVIPMLPKELSNGVCSLSQGEDKLTMSVVMTINGKGKVSDFEIYEGIINSKSRLVYDDVSDVLENEDEAMSEKYRDLLEDFKNMEALAKILKKKRDDRGCIDFDFQEAKIVLDEDGRAVDVAKYDRRIANRIIEEFMIACNETIAENMFWSKVPFLYRIHESPDSDRITEFNRFIANFGYFLKGTASLHPKELQSITNKIKGKKEETVINTIMLRSLKKAIYSNSQEKHFGLASDYYCHFTSPIRRYPDLQIHRIIKEFINGRLKDTSKLETRLALVADQCSINERKAAQLEREVDDIKAAEYMSEHIGEEYEGVISSVTSFGVFVELDNTVEGLIHISNMTDDYYFYDERNYSMIGEMTKKTYKIGDVVNVKLVSVNIQRAEIDFAFCRNKGEK